MRDTVEPSTPDGRGKWVPKDGTRPFNPWGTGSQPEISYDPDPDGRHKGPHWDVEDARGKRRRFRPDGTEIDPRGRPIAAPENVRPPNWVRRNWNDLNWIEKEQVIRTTVLAAQATVAVTVLTVTVSTALALAGGGS